MSVLKDILSISGQAGLFKYVSQGRNGIIVENIEDKKRVHASSTSKISSLEDISIFTDDKDVPLKNVLKSIQEYAVSNSLPDTKADDAKLRSFFATVLPDYDKDRVYASDIKKIVRWYLLLSKSGLLVFEDETVEENEDKVASKA